MNKKQIIEDIFNKMRENGITFEELKQARLAALRPKCMEDFDLLVVEDGVAQRVPFDKGKDMKPIGIFPLKKSTTYVEFKESGPQEYPVEKKDKLPGANTYELWRNIMPELNAKLRELHQPEFEGKYWLNGHEWSGVAYWCGEVKNDKADDATYDNRKPAKVRLIGYL